MGRPARQLSDEARVDRAVRRFLVSFCVLILLTVFFAPTLFGQASLARHDLAYVVLDSQGTPVDGEIEYRSRDKFDELIERGHDPDDIVTVTTMWQEHRWPGWIALARRTGTSVHIEQFWLVRSPDAVFHFTASLYAESTSSDGQISEDPIHDALLNNGVSTRSWEPYWPGISWVVAAFASAWAFLCAFSAATTADRRKHRRSQGLCPFCAYSMIDHAGGPCPECGKLDAEPA